MIDFELVMFLVRLIGYVIVALVYTLNLYVLVTSQSDRTLVQMATFWQLILTINISLTLLAALNGNLL